MAALAALATSSHPCASASTASWLRLVVQASRGSPVPRLLTVLPDVYCRTSARSTRKESNMAGSMVPRMLLTSCGQKHTPQKSMGIKGVMMEQHKVLPGWADHQ